MKTAFPNLNNRTAHADVHESLGFRIQRRTAREHTAQSTTQQGTNLLEDNPKKKRIYFFKI